MDDQKELIKAILVQITYHAIVKNVIIYQHN